jgi:hypothetical protein
MFPMLIVIVSVLGLIGKSVTQPLIQNLNTVAHSRRPRDHLDTPPRRADRRRAAPTGRADGPPRPAAGQLLRAAVPRRDELEPFERDPLERELAERALLERDDPAARD